MSYAAVRGEPYASQLYLDMVLDEVLQSGVSRAAGREGVSLPQLLFYCLRKDPEDVFMVNGATGEKITKSQILKHAVSIARALVSKGARGKNVMIVMRNHQTMAAVYFAVLFAGTVPFIMDPNCTFFEISYYLKLIEPCMVFCDEEHDADVKTALQDNPELTTEVKVANTDELLTNMANGFSEDAQGFQIPDVDVGATVMMLPTSGSTGMPKASLMTHRGLVVQIPMIWSYHTQFPTPTDCCMLLTTPQWVTFSITVNSCVINRIPLLMSHRKPTVEWVQEMLLTFRPTWTFFGPAFVMNLLPTLTEDHFSSLKTLLVLGAPSSIELLTALKDKLPLSATLGDVYGTTETQGYITTAVPGAPLKSTGKIVNIYEYKMLDDDGKTVSLGQNGELYVKGISTIKGYYKDKDLYGESFSHDGWFKTGDLFHIDDCENVYYLERRKFCFKFMGSHVSPEEVEQVICTVGGVQECVVCDTAAGPAAIVVLQPTYQVTRDHIHEAVNNALSEHKRLHGGIAFASLLPHTHSGKLQRAACKTLMQELLAAGKFC